VHWTIGIEGAMGSRGGRREGAVELIHIVGVIVGGRREGAVELIRIVGVVVGGREPDLRWAKLLLRVVSSGKLGKRNGTGRVPADGSRAARERAPRLCPRPKNALNLERRCCS
jgi:3-hydroxyacyl-CoA dehydrogenase